MRRLQQDKKRILTDALSEGGSREDLQELIQGLEKDTREPYREAIFALLHIDVPEEEATRLWLRTVRHKVRLERQCSKAFNIKVAALDYLYSSGTDHRSILLFPKERLADILRIASQDGLTRLSDHTHFLHVLREKLDYAQRYRRPLGMLMLDIDHFKKFNDTFGHPAGDRVLRFVADVLRSETRDQDCAGRYGGEEFGLVMPEVSHDAGQRIAQRIRQRIEEESGRRPEIPGKVTVSVGVTFRPRVPVSAADVVEAADRALYRAKADGRNRVAHLPCSSKRDAGVRNVETKN